MPPKRSTKQTAGLTQPTLSFRNRRSTTTGKAKGAVAATATVHRVDSAASLSSSIDAEEPAVKVNKKKVEKKKEAAITVADDTREVLDSNSKEWNGLYEDAKVEMGGLKPVHDGPQTTKVHHILRVFDLTSKYGPCAGITRLERWERAKRWGLSPPDEIRAILTTQQGEDTVDLRESVLYGWV